MRYHLGKYVLNIHQNLCTHRQNNLELINRRFFYKTFPHLVWSEYLHNSQIVCMFVNVSFLLSTNNLKYIITCAHCAGNVLEQLGKAYHDEKINLNVLHITLHQSTYEKYMIHKIQLLCSLHLLN